MARLCNQCRRTNPPDAGYCFFDGQPLDGDHAVPGAETSINFGTLAFPTPFVFPSGEACRNFIQLAAACRRDPRGAIDTLEHGFFHAFFGTLGRADLSLAARAAAQAPDRERGLDDLLGKLPGSPLEPPVLHVEPLHHDFGVVPVGDDRRFELKLTNKKDRLLFGKAAVDNCPWLALGDSGTSEKLFQFFDQGVLPVRVVGSRLRAYGKPLKAEIVLESNGGTATVTVQVSVPVNAFPEGALAGAMSPRQLAEKAKARPKEAAALIESGAVAQWYQSNGWTYPVQAPTAAGLAAVQQLFEALGLVKPPKVELSESAIALRGRSGERVEYVLTVMAEAKRAAVAHGVSDQAWLTVGKTLFRSNMAMLPLTIESVPDAPGKTLTASVKVTANGQQRFEVPVTLVVAEGPRVPGPTPAALPQTTPSEVPVAPARPDAPPVPVPAGLSPLGIADSPPLAAAPPPLPLAPAPPTLPPLPPPSPALERRSPPPLDRRRKTGGLLLRLLPLLIVAIGLGSAVFRDLMSREPPEEPVPEVDWANPVLAVKFHDGVQPGMFTLPPSMRFGLGTLDPKDPTKFDTLLTYDEFGRSNNVCVKIDKSIEYLWGIDQGTWKQPMKQELGRDRQGHGLIGAKAVWDRTVAPFISVRQIVEVVPGGLSADGKKRLLDTCVVQYDITNLEEKTPHTVGLRFLLDTYIGRNDAVPFTIAGANKLCNTMEEFNTAAEVPDYISALEKQDLRSPGTVAHINLKYGAGLEPPTRVTLGAWPASILRRERESVPSAVKAEGYKTLWTVPVLPMALAKSAENPYGDSAVTIYWDEKELGPKQTRTVGFAYGLGSVTGDQGEGQLGLTAGGDLVAGNEFALTAYVKNPSPGTTITLTLPAAVERVSGAEKQMVPEVPQGAPSPYSPVTWRVKATRSGVFTVKATLSSGVKLQHKLLVQQAKELFK